MRLTIFQKDLYGRSVFTVAVLCVSIPHYVCGCVRVYKHIDTSIYIYIHMSKYIIYIYTHIQIWLLAISLANQSRFLLDGMPGFGQLCLRNCFFIWQLTSCTYMGPVVIARAHIGVSPCHWLLFPFPFLRIEVRRVRIFRPQLTSRQIATCIAAQRGGPTDQLTRRFIRNVQHIRSFSGRWGRRLQDLLCVLVQASFASSVTGLNSTKAFLDCLEEQLFINTKI